jgi:hypothetical protein
METAYSFINLVSYRDAFVLMMAVLVSAETVQNLSTKLHVVTSQKTGPVILTLTTLITWLYSGILKVFRHWGELITHLLSKLVGYVLNRMGSP